MGIRWSMIAAALALVSCGGKKDAAPAAGSAAGLTGSGSALAAGSGSGSATPTPPAMVVDTAAVTALVDAWLAAQNTGNFDAYAAVYADKLEGIKRVGARTWRFDRTGWLADRKHMFTRPMQVAATDVAVRGNALIASITLTQSYTQGAFHDEGPKHLVVIRTASGFKIAREEMLSSSVGAAAGSEDPVYLVIKLGDRYYATFVRDVDPAGTTQPPVAHELSNGTRVAIAAAPRSPDAAKWKAHPLEVVDADGRRCTAVTGEPVLMAGGTPHFGTVQIWRNGDPDTTPPTAPLSAAEIAVEVFAMSTPVLAAPLEITGGCDPILAFEPDHPVAPLTVQAVRLDDALRRQFRQTSAWAAIEDDFEKNYEGQWPWEHKETVTGYEGNGRSFVVISAREGSGCGEFEGALTAIYEDLGGGRLQLVSSSDLAYAEVLGLVDVNGKGKIQAIAKGTDFSTAIERYDVAGTPSKPADAITFPFNDCGC